MAAWNFATLWEIAADNVPDAPALAHGTRTVSWADFDHRADGVARHLLDGARVPRVRTWLWVDDGSDACPSWATPYEEAATTAARRVEAPWGRGDDDLLMIYTGGTTGMPKGVMWRQDDLVRGVIGASARRFRAPVDWVATRESPGRGVWGSLPAPSCTAPAGSRPWRSWRPRGAS